MLYLDVYTSVCLFLSIPIYFLSIRIKFSLVYMCNRLSIGRLLQLHKLCNIGGFTQEFTILPIWLLTLILSYTIEWFQPQMRKITQWLSKLPVKGTRFAVHVFWSKTIFWINWNISIWAAESGAHIDMFWFLLILVLR